MTDTAELIRSVSIEHLLQQRTALLERYETLRILTEEMRQISSSLDSLNHAHLPRYEWEYNGRHHSITDLYRDESEKNTETYRQAIDGIVWRKLMEESGNLALMDAAARQEWHESLRKDVPPLTPANIKATFEQLHHGRDDMFARGVINIFKGLSWNYKTNSPFRLDKKIIITYLTNSYSSGSAEKLSDLERAFHVLDGKPAPEYRHSLTAQLNLVKRDQTTLETPYMKLKWYGNGNGHITFTRLDLVEKLNKIIAAHFPFHIPQDNKRAA